MARAPAVLKMSSLAFGGLYCRNSPPYFKTTTFRKVRMPAPLTLMM